jgi:hypothetical protein
MAWHVMGPGRVYVRRSVREIAPELLALVDTVEV